MPYITLFFDDATFCGTGYTASESLRSNACSIVADLVHNVGRQLPYNDLCKAITYFSKSLHDPLLNINLQQMCCRVLLSLIDCIKQKEQESNVNARSLTLKLLQVIVLKFKSIAKYQVSHLIELDLINKTKEQSINKQTLKNQSLKNDDNEKQQQQQQMDIDIDIDIETEKKVQIDKLDLFLNSFEDKDRIKLKYGPSSIVCLTEHDCRTVIKFLIAACRKITSNIITTKLDQPDMSIIMQSKQLTPEETLIFIKLLKNVVLCLEIYTVSRSINSSNSTSLLIMQKEEKEVIDSLGGIFTLLHPLTLKEIFTQTIDFIIERTTNNTNIPLLLANYFLAFAVTSCTFATILIEYLINKMEVMGQSDIDKSNLYLKLFKLVFGSVSVLATENEKMLKPHLHSLVTKSLDLALKSNEPYNYFLLLRALFRSIGGGNHDLLYEEFLPLLPVLLQNLNELQTGHHKQYLKDLFVELCLTVPVRLSSLLPYLPMLMDPLVSSLNGSQTLISQVIKLN